MDRLHHDGRSETRHLRRAPHVESNEDSDEEAVATVARTTQEPIATGLEDLATPAPTG